MDESAGFLDGNINTEIQIKEEPIDEDELASQDEQSWSMEPTEIVTVKQEEEMEMNSNQNDLQPLASIDMVTSQSDNQSQGKIILIKVKVNGKQNKSRMQYATVAEMKRKKREKARIYRAKETPEQRQKNRERVALYRARETVEQRESRLKKDRERKARQRVAERSISTIYQQRLQEARIRTAQKRLKWTAEQRQENLRKDRKHKRMKRLEQKIGNLMVDTIVNESFQKEQGKFTCDICQYTCELDATFKEHYFTHFHNNSYFCHYCSETFSYMYDLTEHELLHTNGRKPFKCEQCFSEHTSLESLSKHCWKKHKGNSENNFECEICQKMFSSKQAQKMHLQSHPGIETMYPKTPFLCDICGKMITTYQSFQNHYRIHTGEKPYICKECGKSFTAYVGLHYHSRIHTGEKPYGCSECGRAFSQRSSFVVHKRIHSGEKPYECAVCKKSYITSTLLKVHMKKHTDM